jgi:hypothetical protein
MSGAPTNEEHPMTLDPPPRRRLSVDWIAVLVAGVLVLAVGIGALPVIPW